MRCGVPHGAVEALGILQNVEREIDVRLVAALLDVRERRLERRPVRDLLDGRARAWVPLHLRHFLDAAGPTRHCLLKSVDEHAVLDPGNVRHGTAFSGCTTQTQTVAGI